MVKIGDATQEAKERCKDLTIRVVIKAGRARIYRWGRPITRSLQPGNVCSVLRALMA